MSEAAKETVAEPERDGRYDDKGAREAPRGKSWRRIFRSPLPPRETLDDAAEIPLATANFVSKLLFMWASPMVATGFNRPLQATDLWKMDPSREALTLSDKFMANLDRRQAHAAEWNALLPTAKPSRTRQLRWNIRAAWSLPSDYTQFGPTDTYAQRQGTLVAEWRARSGVKHANVAWALSDTFPGFWLAGPWKLVSDVGMVAYPLLIKEIITYAQSVAAAGAASEPLPPIGRGVGLAFALFGVMFVAYTCLRQFFFRSMHEGVLMRAALVAAVYKRAFKLSVTGRAKQPDGKLMTLLSADLSRIDMATEYFHCAWTAPITLVATIILLCLQIGPSGLVGFLVFVVAMPITTWIMKIGLNLRKKSMQSTEKRTKLLQGLLSSMPIIKMFTYETPFLERLSKIRDTEMSSLRALMFTRAGNEAMTLSLPTIASVFAFIMYAGLNKNFNPALIFTALSYFNSLRGPLNQIPKSLSFSADAYTAMQRLTDFFEAETASERIAITPNLDTAVTATNACFQWPKSEPLEESEGQAPEPFAIRNLNLTIPRGRMVAIVGPFGSGKSSLLQGLLGDMTLVDGSVEFGARLGYCQQSPWIQNATIRDNIVFGQPWDEDRYWQCVRNASLTRDLEMLPAGDATEIGEKGINISGGQKQRISIARALYFNADIVLLDDPLSAVDAHVGQQLFNDAILGLRREGKTVVLVTHALHFLPKVDYIYTLCDGKIIEEGTYAELMASGAAFKVLMEDFGGARETKSSQEIVDVDVDVPEIESVVEQDAVSEEQPASKNEADKRNSGGESQGRLMTEEERKIGSVGVDVYTTYFKAGGLLWLVPVVLFASIMQGSSVMSTVWLTYWSENKFVRAGSFYQGVYGMLGGVTAFFTLFTGMTMTALSVNASCKLYDRALHHVFFSPMSFFDTTPLGRIMGVFGKDIDAMDNVVPEYLRLLVLVISMLIGAVVVISINFPYFVAVVFGVSGGYMSCAWYYRRTARELKRLDSLLRGQHYAHFSETLSGMSTIRAYNETERFIKENAYRVDLQDRAYLLIKANQVWLESRLDWFGVALVLAIGLMCATAGGRTVAPASVGMCLTYMGMTTAMLSGIAQLSVEIETSMNAVERTTYYSDGSLPQEAPYEIAATKPKEPWPASGSIQFDRAVMSYRPGLPPVLKGVSFKVEPGERVGIVGRTGAGKTSITVALYRLVELLSGTIKIDDVDISTLGLKTLRASIGIIPQDPVLFSGTLRSNLDPFNQRDDATLHDALRRACLGGRFTLDTTIDDGGSNLSIGERSLVSLARAFVEDAKIMILDEATASVDLETDAKIQLVIREECDRSNKTLLCIAHRLRTIIGWDKVVVMDAGQVAEFGSPLELWDARGIFRGMCEQSSITREEIVKESQR